MTLYRIDNKAKTVHVLDNGRWRKIPGKKEEILVEELEPVVLGHDRIYTYAVTSEP